MRAWAGAVFWIGAMIAPALGAAQAPPTGSATGANGDSEQAAQREFRVGQAAYDAGDYEEALQRFQRAHDLSARPQLLYNVGLAADRLRYNRAALEAWRAYVRQLPDAENRPEVENRIRALEEIVKREEAIGPENAARSVPMPSSAPTSAPSSSRADDSLLSKWWFWAAIGGAAVAITAGVVIASSGDDTAKAMPGSDGMVVLTLTRAP